MPDRSARSPSSAATLLVATTNPGKLREFVQLLDGLSLHIVSLADLPDAPAVAEDGRSYAENAAHKALTIAHWSGCATLADDSGLEVDALRGAPGLRSARFAGEQQDSEANLRKLQADLDGVPAGERTARFRCALAVAAPNGATVLAEGACEGRILDAPRGRGGFGYDPLFLYAPLELTFAELPATVKNQVSHRAQACARLGAELPRFLARHVTACANCRLD